MLDFSLYVIIDEKYINLAGAPSLPTPTLLSAGRRNGNYSLATIVTEVCEGGATVIQLREKSKEIKEILEDAIIAMEIISKYKIPFIVNDRIDIALASGASGIHLGQFDMPLNYAKRIFKGIIGLSVSTVEQAVEAEREGADYLGVGSLFPSPTKPKPTIELSVITEIKRRVKIPVLGIGGITLDRVESVLSAGADGICVASDIFNHSNIRERVREFKSRIQGAKIIRSFPQI